MKSNRPVPRHVAFCEGGVRLRFLRLFARTVNAGTETPAIPARDVIIAYLLIRDNFPFSISASFPFSFKEQINGINNIH